ncbi:CBS domain-containing protein [Neorhizobium sp. LjRoot104]|uniref:CBS domain-containing protein n=1 Tax=Neorhizobium sp. LjRoot104 TaxID=3342254 RepID=UPI003F50215D
MHVGVESSDPFKTKSLCIDCGCLNGRSVTVEPETTVEAAAKIMAERSIKRLPVWKTASRWDRHPVRHYGRPRQGTCRVFCDKDRHGHRECAGGGIGEASLGRCDNHMRR